MRLARFAHQGATRLGVIVGRGVVDLARAAPELPRDMVAFLTLGDEAMRRARVAAEHADSAIALESVRLEAPIFRPRKFLGIGIGHIENAVIGAPD